MFSTLKKLLAATAVILTLAHASAQATTLLDVSGSGTIQLPGTAVTGGTFYVTNAFVQPAGSGVIDPFLRVQAGNLESGYNTPDLTAAGPLDDKKPAQNENFLATLQLSQIPVLQIGSTLYREFLLDANQSGNGPVSLNQVQIFQSTVGAMTDSGFSFTQTADSTHNAVISFGSPNPANNLIFQMSNSSTAPSTSNQVLIDSGRGSGTGDMFLYVANDLFTGGPTSYITLFSQFGNPPGIDATTDGFEEWSVREGVPNPVPEPTVLAMALSGLIPVGLIGLRRLRRK